MDDLLAHILNDLQYIKVESSLIIGSIVLLVAGLIKRSRYVIKTVFLLTVLIGIYFNMDLMAEGELLSGSLYASAIGNNFKIIFLFSASLILLFRRTTEHATEFYFLILSVLIGSIFLMSANSLLVLFLGVELASFSSYILTNFSFKKQGHEAGIKYLLFGAMSSAIMLIGIGILYGSLNTLYISEWQVHQFSDLLPTVGLGLMLCGILFKASIFPFHIWVPATYQSGPNDAIAFISIVPKLGALVFLKRALALFDPADPIIVTCLIFGILTLVVGSFAALRQSDARRTISFGAVAHTGFLLPLAIIKNSLAEESFWWYSMVYAIMNVSVFYLLDFFERNEIFHFKNYNSLGSKVPYVSVAITAVVVSLVGLPPLAGFTAKFFLFSTLWEFYSMDGTAVYGTYLLVAAFITVISLFFYLRIPYHLFLAKSVEKQSIESSFSTKFIATLFTIVLLLLFFVPQILMVMQELLNNTPHE